MKDCAAHNRIYRVVWNRARGVWMVVGELARGLGKGNGRKKLSLRGLLLLVPLSLFSPLALAAPTGGQVTAGAGSITQSGAVTTINQSSQNLSLSWKSFNVASSETVNFNQPNASALAINRIYDTNGSRIMGHLNANGQVWLINPNGILFGSSAQVNVGGLVASTLDTADNSSFTGNGTGSVVNEGSINASQYVALLGHSVTNRGVITARLGTVGGTVAMGAGDNVSLTFSGNSLVKLQVNQSVIDALVANHGLIKADGGLVIMNAGARDTLLASVVNNDGIVQAQTVSNHKGTITLLGGMAAGTVNVGGTLDASAPNGGNGGSIETSAHTVKVADGTTVTTKAANGLSGTWLIDPADFTIAASGGDMSGSALDGALSSGNVTILSSSGGTSGTGSINVNDLVIWSANTLTLTAANDININAVMSASGTASLAMNPATANGADTAVAGGTVKVGLNAGGFTGRVDFSGTGTLSIGGTAYTVISSMAGLQGMSTSGHYVLDANLIDTVSTGSGFTPIGSGTTNFSGVFDGLGHTISNLYINPITTGSNGLFRIVGTGGIVRNVGLVGGSVTGFDQTGELAGVNHGTISNSYATGSVSGTNALGGQKLGGLVGSNYNGTISNSYATGSVSGTGSNIGGLVGSNRFGTITDSYATGSVSGSSNVGGLVGSSSFSTISNSYATGSISGTGSNVGGLVGFNSSNGTISNSYATGNVTGSGNHIGGLVGLNGLGVLWNFTINNSYATGSVSGTGEVGGLVGYNNSNGTISSSYATGGVSGISNVGGLVGYNHPNGTVSNSYWDITTTGKGNNAGYGANTGTVTGGGGLTTAALASALPTGLSSSVWANGGNQTTPYLLANASLGTVSGHVILGTDTSTAPAYYGVIQTLTQLQDINGTGLAGSYVLGTNIAASATSGWNGGAGFMPIGNSTTKFTGVFDGLGHTIGNLTINRLSSNNLGLFGVVGTGGAVRNVGLVGGSIKGNSNIGELAGGNYGSISNSYATGSVLSPKSNVGGLVGYNYTGTIRNAYATGSLYGIGSNVGGLVGNNGGTIGDSYATGSVGGGGYANFGGLVGYNNGTISNSYATGSISNASSNSGGLVGSNYYGTISNSYAAGSVSGTNYAGGLAGRNLYGTIGNSYWDITTTGKGTTAGYGSNRGTVTGGGGLTTAQLAAALPSGFSSGVWANAGNRTTPYLLANASFSTVSGHVILGTDTGTAPTYYDVIQTLTQLQDINGTGLAGSYVLGTNIAASATSGWNGGAGFAPIGNSTTKFTGVFDGLGHTIGNLTINRPTANLVGLFGRIDTGGIVRNIGLVGGSVSGKGYVGELAGTNRGTISNVYATGSVSGGTNVGGLVGGNAGGGTISGAYATGSVSGSGNNVGGLVGWNAFSSTISNAYATGSVSGSGNVGGLVGSNHTSSTISNAYATGSVSGSAGVGGLVGSNDSTISNGYWDTTTGISAGYGINIGTVTGGGGLTDTQMQQQANFTGFDFTNTWVQYDGHTDPLLRTFMTALTVTATGGSKTYDGVAGNGVSYSATPDSRLLGTLSYGISANAGSYTTSLGGLYSDQQGYAIGYANSALTVNKAALTVTATGASKTYDGTAYSGGNGVSYTGFVNGETVSVLGGSLSYGGSSQGAVNAGRYAITPGGLSSGNYTLRYVDGVLTIRNALPSNIDESADTYAFSLLHQPPTSPGHIPLQPAPHGHPVPTAGFGDSGMFGHGGGVHIVNDGVHMPPDRL